MRLPNITPSAVKGKAKDIVYSPASRRVARKIVSSTRDTRLEAVLADHGFDSKLRRISSENLPQGRYFAKLTIHDWQDFKDRQFILKQNGKPVYGNQIEPPARGFPLEYRNIVVSSRYPSKFSLNIPANYSLSIGRGAFTTPQQVTYDRKYGVQQSGDVFYSLRGNVTNPRKILITFPGFGPSTSRISYAVSYLKQITDADLSETLMICFQDRYMAAGTYMVTDSCGRPLYSRVKAVIDEYLKLFGLSGQNMLLFGASKGGSTALIYAQEYPEARIVVAVPQMSLPYYMSKPFFKNNLYTVNAMHEITQPEDLVRRYFAEGRQIDYFYTENDELSNHSLIEFAHDVPGLSKYRVQGKHGEVARTALPTILGLMKQFLTGESMRKLSVEETHSYLSDCTTRAQIRLSGENFSPEHTNWWLRAPLGRTSFHQLMTDHSYSWVKYLSKQQRLHGGRDPISSFSAVLGVAADGKSAYGALSEKLTAPGETTGRGMSPAALQLEAEKTTQYALIDEGNLHGFTYRSVRGKATNQRLEVHLMSSLRALENAYLEILSRKNSASVVLVYSPDKWAGIDLLALRFSVLIRASGITFIPRTHELDETALARMGRTAWPGVKVILRKATTKIDLDLAPFPRWAETGRLVLV